MENEVKDGARVEVVGMGRGDVVESKRFGWSDGLKILIEFDEVSEEFRDNDKLQWVSAYDVVEVAR